MGEYTVLTGLCFVVAAAVEILSAVRTIVPDWLEILTVLVRQSEPTVS
jgi:hypothetical protein